DLAGWSIVLYDGTNKTVYNTTGLSGVILNQCSGRGTVVVNYPSNGIQNGSPDGMALVDNTGAVIEFLSYEATFVASGGAANGSTTPIGSSLPRDAFNRWTLGGQTFGQCNPAAPPPLGNSISFSGRVATDPALPIGFQAQIFATVRDPSNNVVNATITWSSDTPAIASI